MKNLLLLAAVAVVSWLGINEFRSDNCCEEVASCQTEQVQVQEASVSGPSCTPTSASATLPTVFTSSNGEQKANCNPANCDPTQCDPSQCDPSNCDPSQCDPANCEPANCKPNQCKPKPDDC